ncbi:MAG: DVU_1555 family C-GCAxxG-C-C protein [Halodesulfovibrio sp.]
MIDQTSLRMMQLAGQGYCCSQILILLALEGMGRENPDLVRAMAGLCHGMGDCDGPCGVLTGGVCLLGMYTGKGTDDDVADDRLPLMLESFRDWFTEAVAGYGGIACGSIAGGDCRTPDPSRCGTLLSGAYARIMEIVVENGMDPMTGKGDHA